MLLMVAPGLVEGTGDAWEDYWRIPESSAVGNGVGDLRNIDAVFPGLTAARGQVQQSGQNGVVGVLLAAVVALVVLAVVSE